MIQPSVPAGLPPHVIDTLVRTFVRTLSSGRSYANREMYPLFVTFCEQAGVSPPSRMSLGRALSRYGATGFYTNSAVGRCWYLPTPSEREAAFWASQSALADSSSS